MNNDFGKLFQVYSKPTLLSGVISSVSPNGRGRVTLNNGPVLDDIALPDNSVRGDQVMLFREPNGGSWKVMRSGQGSNVAVTPSTAKNTFVSTPEHVRWFSVYNKVVLLWYVSPSFEGGFEVQISHDTDHEDALTWVVTTSSMTMVDASGDFWFRIRAINKNFVQSRWTSWTYVDRNRGNLGGSPDEVAYWRNEVLTGDSRLRWIDGRLRADSQSTNTYINNLAHHGLEMSAPSIVQTFKPPANGTLDRVSIFLSNLLDYSIRVCLTVNSASVFTSDVSQITGVFSISPNASVTTTDNCEIVLSQIDEGDYPHVYYTRWNAYQDGSVTTPTSTPADVDIAFSARVSSDTTPGYVAVNDEISFSDKLFLHSNDDDLELHNGDGILISIAEHNHDGTSGMGQPLTHSQLDGLQGGGPDEYYHLTSAEEAAATRLATTSQSGLITELATDAETQTGTDEERAVTPHGLRADVPATPAASRGVRLDASGNLTLPGNASLISSDSGKPVLLIENQNGDTVSAQLEFYKNSASPANNDFLGTIIFNGEDSAGNKRFFAGINAQGLDTTPNDEAGGITFYVAMDHAISSLLTLRGYNGSVDEGTIIFNDNAQDVDFYVESVGVADALFVRGSDGQVTIGAYGAGYLSTDAGGVISATAGTPVIGGGSGAANRVAFWSDANTLTSDAGLTVDAAGNGYVVADDGYVGITDDVRTVYDSSSGYIIETLDDAAGADEWRVNNTAANVANIDSIGQMDILNGNITLKLGADSGTYTRTDATNKYTRIAAAHYTNAEEPVALMVGVSTSTANAVYIGGATSILNAATSVVFYTAVNNTTVAGTERGRVNQSGDWGFGVTSPTAQVHIDQSSSTGAQPVLKLGQADVSEEAIYFVGTSGAATADQTLVDAGDFTTPGALLAWIKVVVEDTRSGGIGTVDGWIPVYAIPTA